MKSAQLGNDAVHGSVFDLPGFLDPEKKLPDIVPGQRFRRDLDLFAVIEVWDKVSTIGFDGMLSKIPESEYPDKA